MVSDGQQKKQRKVRPLLERIPEPSDDGAHAGNSKLARALGSSDYHTREKGVQALTRFLQRKASVDERDMLKIWKGLFYAFWHSDKQPVQSELADRLAAVLSDLQPREVAFTYFSCFMKTMRREWFGIDRLRLDKFLMLIRKFIGQLLKVLADSKWNTHLVTKYMDHLRDHVLLPSDTYRALGIAYHVSDIFLPELTRVVATVAEAGLGADKAAVPAEALTLLLQPFCSVLVKAGDAPVLVRIREAVFDGVLEEVLSPSDGQPLRHLDVPRLAADLFDLGGQPETSGKNRQALYAVSSALERARSKKQKKEVGQVRQSEGGQEGKQVTQVKQADQPSSTAATPTAAEPGTSSGTAGKKKRKASAMNGLVSKEVTEEPAVASVSHPPEQELTPGQKKSAGVAKSAAKLAKLIADAKAAPSDQPIPKQQPSSGSDKRAGKTAALINDAHKVVVGTASVDAAATNGTPQAAASGRQEAADQRAGRSMAKTAGKSVAASAKKRVQINLKKNLYFDFGGPVPHPDVRTPQTSRSKGGILKRMSAPHSAPAKSGHTKTHTKADPVHANGGSADKARESRARKPGRARAALFF